MAQVIPSAVSAEQDLLLEIGSILAKQLQGFQFGPLTVVRHHANLSLRSDLQKVPPGLKLPAGPDEVLIKARSGKSKDQLEKRLRQTQLYTDVARYFNKQGIPAVQPINYLPPFMYLLPDMQRGWIFSFWKYLELSERKASGGDLGGLLKGIHGLVPPPELLAALPRFSDPFVSVRGAIEEDEKRPKSVLSPDQEKWLKDRIEELQKEWNNMPWLLAVGLIHGDAHPYNLLVPKEGDIRITDFERVGLGPREWDIVQILYFQRRFDLHQDEVNNFWEKYEASPSLKDWKGWELLIAMREISGLGTLIRKATSNPLTQSELTWRLHTLTKGMTNERWWTSAELEPLQRHPLEEVINQLRLVEQLTERGARGPDEGLSH